MSSNSCFSKVIVDVFPFCVNTHLLQSKALKNYCFSRGAHTDHLSVSDQQLFHLTVLLLSFQHRQDLTWLFCFSNSGAEGLPLCTSVDYFTAIKVKRGSRDLCMIPGLSGSSKAGLSSSITACASWSMTL
ncbi:hypothetical protein XENORESO_005745 [Xenotaenia resolanae]|uniref:Uncharacterized protein n=1 Tax=Xenotaenia resolanae TaxID=208358 RepID=A0ABV0WED6_9TELE